MTLNIDAVVIGAGQAGLAASMCLTREGVEHVVLEAGRPGQSWLDRRPTLRLLTPNWMTRLPGFAYAGPDQEGYMGMAEVAALLDAYAAGLEAPILCHAPVDRVTTGLGRFLVHSARGTFLARAVVVATGACREPRVPEPAAGLSPGIVQIAAAAYRSAAGLPPGGVLVVGASASGAQIAEELAMAGRRVVLAAGRHTRVPRVWRGRDIMDWMDRAGILDEAPARLPGDGASSFTSLQLCGSPDRRDLDLRTLAALGVEIVGRVEAAEATRVRLSRDLPDLARRADDRMRRLLARIDAHIGTSGEDAPPGSPPGPVVPDAGARDIDLASEGLRTVVWATGYRPDFGWLDATLRDASGYIVHEEGIAACPGLYVLGMPQQRCRKSSFIDGVGGDALLLAGRIRDGLTRRRRAA
jgi:putative flavoprotein involved in K+ transport